MKIDLLNPLKAPTTSSVNNKLNRASEIDTTRALPSSSVELSKAILKVTPESSSETSFNLDKVNEIKVAIEEGRFVFDSTAIADKLISTARDLLLTQYYKR